MNTFSNIKELFTALNREVGLLSEMFKKRKSVKNFQYDYALDLVDNNDNRIKFLIDREVIRQNGNNLEIDDLFLQFFEQVLNANEEINTSYINENIEKIKQTIDYYLNENSEQRKYSYLREIKKTLRNVGNITLRNVVDLKRNIDNTFKNEPNYKNKKAKLHHFDNKRKDIVKLIELTEKLLSDGSITFFKTATDEELSRIIVQLKIQLQKCAHNLIEIEKQIIDFLNQIQYQNNVIEKLRQVKYLKDQFTLETSTDFKAVLNANNAVIFEPNPTYPLKLSLEYLQADEEVYASILKIAKQINSGVKFSLPLADKISSEYLQTQIEEEVQINLEEIKNGFVASSYNLLDFVCSYQFPKEVYFEDIVTIYCQLISQYDATFDITEKYQERENIEFAVVYPK
ncbi:MAG: hypothetical protein LBH84_04425 [Prevotellaceae bacterium]|jgi:hypothetical protein|nr:hypothetical protein [Prevotellaceae bacterium]